MSIVSTVEEQYPTLSRQERKVALKVIQSPKEVQKMTISSLAKTVDVSNATITRFVKKMGCTNFYNFKLQLAESPAPKAPRRQSNGHGCRSSLQLLPKDPQRNLGTTLY
ncbi:hypothetical protein NOX35_28690 (plasmid) [Comamonas sp. C11]|nr:hypothetical protein [Comamonas sp. C11]UUC96769.1 hypothetical protein NOX35_28690 [Comamonas sp. C11]